jgi:hypothetical protein
MMREPESQEEGRNCEPEEQAVRERAYAIWVAEGEPDGCEVEHWMRARRELEHEAGPQ